MPHRPGSAARLRALGFAAVLLVGLAACSGADGTSSQDSGAAEQAPEGAAVDQDSAVEPAAGEPDVSGGGDDAAIGQGGEALPPAPPARPGDRVIKEGTVRVEVAAGGYLHADGALLDHPVAGPCGRGRRQRLTALSDGGVVATAGHVGFPGRRLDRGVLVDGRTLGRLLGGARVLRAGPVCAAAGCQSDKQDCGEAERAQTCGGTRSVWHGGLPGLRGDRRC